MFWLEIKLGVLGIEMFFLEAWGKVQIVKRGQEVLLQSQILLRKFTFPLPSHMPPVLPYGD